MTTLAQLTKASLDKDIEVTKGNLTAARRRLRMLKDHLELLENVRKYANFPPEEASRKP